MAKNAKHLWLPSFLKSVRVYCFFLAKHILHLCRQGLKKQFTKGRYSTLFNYPRIQSNLPLSVRICILSFEPESQEKWRKTTGQEEEEKKMAKKKVQQPRDRWNIFRFPLIEGHISYWSLLSACTCLCSTLNSVSFEKKKNIEYIS